MRAPTTGNMMLYSIIVIRDGEKKRQLSESCDHRPFIANAPVVLDAMFEERQSRFPQNNSVGATNVGQLRYARKTG